ncbi:MAG: hypothetical protein PF481_04905 [Bacteroidales bacterium]|jgi:hypothetical protein|nr:hypothetical protein [Bacteroidales bacterium]
MVIHNNKLITKIQKKFFISLILLLSLIVLTLAADTILSEFGYIESFSFLYRFLFIVGYCAFFYISFRKDFSKKHHFIYFSDDDPQFLVFRFYPLFQFKRSYTTYKLPITSFYSSEIQRDDENVWLILYQKNEQQKIAKYPAINLNSFSEKQILSLSEVLNQYSQTKK